MRQIADEYLRGHYAFRPAEATAAGLHEYDAQLDTRAPEAVAREVRRLRAALAELQRLPEWRLTPEARYDYLVLQSHARAQLLELEEIGAWRRDPNLYNRLAAEAIDNVLKREYAPGERRLDAMMARARQIPACSPRPARTSRTRRASTPRRPSRRPAAASTSSPASCRSSSSAPAAGA